MGGHGDSSEVGAKVLDRAELSDLVFDLGGALYGTELELARAVVAVDDLGGWQVDGARSLVAWVAVKLRMPFGRAAALVRLGRALVEFSEVAAALDGGRCRRGRLSRLLG
jgi:hypothetical protein